MPLSPVSHGASARLLPPDSILSSPGMLERTTLTGTWKEDPHTLVFQITETPSHRVRLPWTFYVSFLTPTTAILKGLSSLYQIPMYTSKLNYEIIQPMG